MKRLERGFDTFKGKMLSAEPERPGALNKLADDEDVNDLGGEWRRSHTQVKYICGRRPAVSKRGHSGVRSSIAFHIQTSVIG